MEKVKSTESVPTDIHLSALIITYNEEHNIKQLLQDLDFADEILVIDSFSTDKTVEIAQSFSNVKVSQHVFENYALQRNYALSLAKGTWILFLDADERLTPALKDEIIQTIQNKAEFNSYYFKRTFMFANEKLHFSGWQTDKIIRLFRKENTTYSLQKTVHEKLNTVGDIGKLNNRLIHYSYTDYFSYKEKMTRYGKLKASEEFIKGTKPHFFHFYLRPSFQFINQYLLRLGILDGKKGIIICYLNAFSVYIRFQELKRMKLKN
ncbi:glycosyltransferase family 2 protein [Flavobacterium degerlachei]|jgi:glycosyltransferase involved in cell wall biosynthesis|uniref:Glycosyl transferase family 2 n=1 Tax=Flavobacterium degerlachei TaxID=229203 RepID=A0A1H3A9B1_9FLAO|nr:glycosyltransferase family 2 protein [Flavobacterium degerlachei]SDX25459.1 Glycosyl transferase family 2 [Flavobacterium degerlachei]